MHAASGFAGRFVRARLNGANKKGPVGNAPPAFRAGVLDLAISLQRFVARHVCSVILRNEFVSSRACVFT
jgi:hypothetical protein